MNSPSRAPSTNFTIFVFLLALGTLIHKTQLWEGLSQPLPFATTALCVALLFRPHSVRLLLAFAVLTIAEATQFAPFYFLNHMVYVALLCYAIIGAYVSIYLRERRWPTSTDELEPILFPLARAGLYLMFFFAVLHKTNHTFLFDPVMSCAADHYADLRGRLPFLPEATPGIAAALPWLTWATEASVPTLLFFKRTRPLGFYVAFGFHYVMGINDYQGFSAYALAIYVPFMPVDLHKQVASAWEVLEERYRGQALLKTSLVLVEIFAVLMILGEATDRTYQMARVGKLWYLVIAPPLYLAYAYFFHTRRAPVVWPETSPRRPVYQLVLLALFCVQSMMPYLGYKTQSSFGMYSNVQTEQGWNHLFLPEWLRIGTFQDSLVTLRSAEGMTLLRPWERDFFPNLVAIGDVQVTMFEFRRELAAHCRAGQAPISIGYEIDGVRYDVADVCQDPALSTPNNWFLEKFFWFRPVLPRQACIH